MVFGVMHPAVAFLVMIGMLALMAVGLVATGIVKIHVETHGEDKEELDLEEVKALDDSTLINRVLKWLARRIKKGK